MIKQEDAEAALEALCRISLDSVNSMGGDRAHLGRLAHTTAENLRKAIRDAINEEKIGTPIKMTDEEILLAYKPAFMHGRPPTVFDLARAIEQAVIDRCVNVIKGVAGTADRISGRDAILGCAFLITGEWPK